MWGCGNFSGRTGGDNGTDRGSDVGCGGRGDTDDDRLDAAVDSLPENRLDVVCSDPVELKLERLPYYVNPTF
jgi:hypothetical protein